MRIAFLVCRALRPFYGFWRFFNAPSVRIEKFRPIRRKVRRFSLSEAHETARVGQKRGNIRGDIRAVGCICGNEWAVAARCVDLIRTVAEYYPEGIRAAKTFGGAAYRRKRIVRLAVIHINEVRRAFCIRVACKCIPCGGKLCAQLKVILDYSVVNEHKVCGGLRVGVCFARRSVSRPARVTDAAAPFDAAHFIDRFGKPAYTSDPSDGNDAAVARDRDTRRVVAAVFKRRKPLKQNARSIPFSCVAYYSAHQYHLLDILRNIV